MSQMDEKNGDTTHSVPHLRVSVIEIMGEDIDIEIPVLLVHEELPINVGILDDLLHL